MYKRNKYYSNGEPEDVTEKYGTWRNIPDELKSDCHVHMDSGFSSSDGSINLSKIWPVLIKIMEKHGNEYTRIDINYEVDDGYLFNPVVIGRRPFTPAETKEIEDKKQLELENKKTRKRTKEKRS